MRSSSRTKKNLTMQRRHFELIANTINSLPVSDKKRCEIAIAFSQVLRNTNPNFNYAFFMAACMEKDK